MQEFYTDSKALYEVKSQMSAIESRLDKLESWRAETTVEIQTIKEDAVEADEKTRFMESVMDEMKEKIKVLERSGWSDKAFLLLAALCMIMVLGLILRLFGI
jgi:uncharacterized coiled-coil protein SlyX